MSSANVPSPASRLLIGLAVTLAVVGVFSAYTLRQIDGIRDLQTRIVDRNRKNSLQLLRIQHDLHALALAMRDMLAGDEPYPLDAWEGQFRRIRTDLEDALRREAEFAPADRGKDSREYIANSLAQFWTTADRVFALSRQDQAAARDLIRSSLEPQQAALTTAIARLLVANNEVEQEASDQIQAIYGRVERRAYIFLVAAIGAILATGLYMMRANRRLFDEIAHISEHRRDLARRLITAQEEVLHSLSRELHDEFGQVLTALGAMLRRVHKQLPPGSAIREDLDEVRDAAQSALEKVRSVSQVLHPSILDDGLEKAIDWYVPLFERQTGIAVQYEKTGQIPAVPHRVAVNVYRVLQEALNNVARHSGSPVASVRVAFQTGRLRIEVEDRGSGIPPATAGAHRGTGMTAMRERAELLNGAIDFLRPGEKGTLVRLDVPVPEGQTDE